MHQGCLLLMPDFGLAGCVLVQVDVFSFAIIMQEVFSHTLTSAIVVGPTQNPEAAELYAFKVSL